jgi:hypothetical protein
MCHDTGMRLVPVLALVLSSACGGAAQQPLSGPVTPAPTTVDEEARREPPLPIETGQPAGQNPLPETSAAPPPPPGQPWGMAVERKRVPKIYLTEHGQAENKATCPLLVLTDLGDEGTGARPRRASFAGGWAIAYDKAGLPGTDKTGADCKTCGRSAFGVAGTGVAPDEGGPEWPKQLRWEDGSLAGYGPEGGTGPKSLAYVRVANAGCLYNVWSTLGEEHLALLLRGLRRVGD